MTFDAEKYREARRKYLASLSPYERKQIEDTKSKAEVESKKRREELKEILEPFQKLYEENLHHIKARDILKESIQAAIDNPSITPEVKETGEFFIMLLEETGNSFKYDFDAVTEPIVKIAKVEIPTMGGTARAELSQARFCGRAS